MVGDTSGNVGGVTGPGSEDHFGTMTNGTGSEGGFSTVTFTLTALGSNFWTDAADVLTPTTGYAAAYGHGFEAVTAAQDAGYSTSYGSVNRPWPPGNSRRRWRVVWRRPLGAEQEASFAWSGHLASRSLMRR